MTDDSHVENGNGHTAFVGPDATNLFRAMIIRSAIKLYLNAGIAANRAYTPSAMRAAASGFTKKRYTRNELAKAGTDLDVWIKAMQAAMPVVVKP